KDENFLPGRTFLQALEQLVQRNQTFLHTNLAFQWNQKRFVVNDDDMAGEQKKNAVLSTADVEKVCDRLFNHGFERRPRRRIGARLGSWPTCLWTGTALLRRRRLGQPRFGGIAQLNDLAGIDMQDLAELVEKAADVVVFSAISNGIGVEIVVHADRERPSGKDDTVAGWASIWICRRRSLLGGSLGQFLPKRLAHLHERRPELVRRAGPESH